MLGHNIGIELSGRTRKHGSWSLSSSYAHRFEGPAPRPSRVVWMVGFRGFKIDWSLMLQIYRPGMELDWHEDGYNIHNRVWSVVLWQPRKGGELKIDGPYKRWGRFYSFDGGVSKHCVTPCGGHRVVLMFQRGSKKRIDYDAALHSSLETERVQVLHPGVEETDQVSSA